MILLIMQYTLFSKEIFFNSKIIMLKDEFYSGAKKKQPLIGTKNYVLYTGALLWWC